MLNHTVPLASDVDQLPAKSTGGGLRLGRLNLELRQHISPWYQALILAGAVFVGLGLSAALLVASGVKPAALFDEFVVETLTDSESLHSILFQAAPLIFVGVGAALAFRVRFWNLDIEGANDLGRHRRNHDPVL